MGNVRQTGTQAREETIYNDYLDLLRTDSNRRKLDYCSQLAIKWNYTSEHIRKVINRQMKKKKA